MPFRLALAKVMILALMMTMTMMTTARVPTLPSRAKGLFLSVTTDERG